MKYVQKTRHIFTVLGVIAALALATGWMAPANTVQARAKAFSLPTVYNWSFGQTQNGSGCFATMHKSGEVNADQISFNITDKATTTLNLGPGHGTWKYNANRNKVTITTFHTDRDGSGKYFKIVQSMTPDDTGNLAGKANIFQYSSISAPEPESSWYMALCTNEAIKS